MTPGVCDVEAKGGDTKSRGQGLGSGQFFVQKILNALHAVEKQINIFGAKVRTFAQVTQEVRGHACPGLRCQLAWIFGWIQDALPGCGFSDKLRVLLREHADGVEPGGVAFGDRFMSILVLPGKSCQNFPPPPHPATPTVF